MPNRRSVYGIPYEWLKEMLHYNRMSYRVKQRAKKSHKHKKDVRKQKQHLKAIKTEKQLKQIRLASQRKQIARR